jgi:hypothetical protein
VGQGEPGWEGGLAACLGAPAQRGAAVAVILTMAEPSEELLARALECTAGLSVLVWNLCAVAAVPADRVARLLRHPDRDVAVQAALGEWQAPPSGSVRPALETAWREAILRCRDELPVPILQAFPGLASDWLAALFEGATDPSWHEHHAVGAAYDVLTAPQRRDLLGRVPRASWADEAVQRLVGDDPDLYRHLLGIVRLRKHHLAPLRGRPEGAWLAKAGLALEAGYTPEELAAAAPRGAWWWGGSVSSQWAEWVRLFEGLEGHPDPGIRQIGRAGREDARARFERARRRERQEAVHGDW